MGNEVGRLHVVDVEAGAAVPPEGHFLYARDTDKAFKSDGTTLTELAASGGAYSDEQAQDAVGAMVDVSLTYNDATPSLSVSDNGVTNAKIRDSAALSVIGRSANSIGDPGDIAGSAVGDVLQVLAGPTVGFASLGAVNFRRPSWDNPPSSPHAYDDEFDISTLDAKWTLAATAGSFVAGSLDYAAAPSTDTIYDLSTIPGWLAIQSGSTSLAEATLTQSYTPSTNSTLFARFGWQSRDVGTNGEGNFYVRLLASGDTNEYVFFGVTRGTLNSALFGGVSNNGVLTRVLSANVENATPTGSAYIAMWKKSDTYHFGMSIGSSGIFSYLGSVTKTGVTAFDSLQIVYTTDNQSPAMVEGVDFIRYKASLDYSLVNP